MFQPVQTSSQSLEQSPRNVKTRTNTKRHPIPTELPPIPPHAAAVPMPKVPAHLSSNLYTFPTQRKPTAQKNETARQRPTREKNVIFFSLYLEPQSPNSRGYPKSPGYCLQDCSNNAALVNEQHERRSCQRNRVPNQENATGQSIPQQSTKIVQQRLSTLKPWSGNQQTPTAWRQGRRKSKNSGQQALNNNGDIFGNMTGKLGRRRD